MRRQAKQQLSKGKDIHKKSKMSINKHLIDERNCIIFSKHDPTKDTKRHKANIKKQK